MGASGIFRFPSFFVVVICASTSRLNISRGKRIDVSFSGEDEDPVLDLDFRYIWIWYNRAVYGSNIH